MKENSLARRYAKALTAVLNGEEQYRRVRADLENFSRVLSADEQLHTGMQTFLFSQSQKREALDAAASTLSMDDVTRRFLGTVVAENRLSLLDLMRTQLDLVWQERQGVEPVVVFSVLKLDARQIDRLARNLEHSFGRRVALDNRIDPDLIAGIRVMRGSTVYDFSLRGNLQKLREAIAGD
jgi:F-type H+-transporting ATPase subunit delta